MSFHLAIDAVGTKHGGGATVLLDVLQTAINDPRVSKITIFCSPRNHRNFDIPMSSKIVEIEVLPAERTYLYRIWWYEVGLAKACYQQKVDILLCLNGAGRTHFSIPQITYIQQSLPFSKEALKRCSRTFRFRMVVLKQLMRCSSQYSTRVIVQTPTMRRWVSQQFAIDEMRIDTVLPLPQSFPEYNGERTASLIESIPPNQRLLYVGNLEPYKNLEVVSSTIMQIRQVFPDTTLFITCENEHPFCQKDGVVGLGHLCKSDLRYVYESVTCLVQPSLVETVSLPLLEAMSLGTPIVVADRPYGHDVCGPAAIYFDPLSQEDFAQKMAELLKNEDLRNQLTLRGKARINTLQELQSTAMNLIDIIENKVFICNNKKFN